MVGFRNYKTLRNPAKIITVLMLVTFISELLSRVFIKLYANSCPPYHIYYPIHFFCLTTFYSCYLKNIRSMLSWANVIFVLLAGVNVIYFQTPREVPTNLFLIASFVYVLCALLLFKKMLTTVKATPLFKQSLFWYNTATLVHYTFTFFCWSFYNRLVDTGYASTLGNIVYIIGMAYYVVTGFFIYFDSRKKIMK